MKHLKKNVLIKNATFFNIYDYVDSFKCLSDIGNLGLQQTFTSIPVINAVCLTILYTQQNFSANVQISSTNFFNNTGSYSGAMLVLHFNSVTNSQTIINNSYFIDNSNIFSCSGSTLSFFIIFNKHRDIHLSSMRPLIVSNSVFKPQHVKSVNAYKPNVGVVSVVIHNLP